MANPVDVVIKGMALNSFGLTAENTIAGLGLNTFGNLWPCDGIWAPACPNVSTAWVGVTAAFAATWVSADPSITTTWMACAGMSGTVEQCTD